MNLRTHITIVNGAEDPEELDEWDEGELPPIPVGWLICTKRCERAYVTSVTLDLSEDRPVQFVQAVSLEDE